MIRMLYPQELACALELVKRVFMQFEAPEYSQQGVEEFLAFVAPQNIAAKVKNGRLYLWGCFKDEKLVGVLAMKNSGHVSLLFVEKEYHRQGIAGAMFAAAKEHIVPLASLSKITVNSSPYAEMFYEKIGFSPLGPEQTVNGIRFIPMEYPLHKK